MHILYAEDSTLLAEPVVYLLKACGHRVTHVLDGAAAVASYQAETPHLILMDVLMPVMDGIEATAKIKAIPSKHWIPLMIFSALNSNEDLVKGLEAGADDYMAKPIDLNVLIAKVNAMQRIVDMQSRLFSILDNVHDGIITIDQRGLVQSYNLAAEHIFGYAASEIQGQNVNMLMPEPFHSEHDTYLHNYFTSHQPKIIGIGRKVQGRRKNGEIFPMHLGVTAINNSNELNFIGVVRDISQEEEDRLCIEHLAMHDTLTGLPNRAHFSNQVLSYIRGARPFALLFIDIDGFKPVNDNFGHDIGDQVLITLAQRMSGILAKSDVVARLGGDEFVVLLPEIGNVNDAERVGMRILAKIGEPMHFNDNNCSVGASIGVALYPAHGQHYELLLNAADNAMYQAKRSGKNKVVVSQ